MDELLNSISIADEIHEKHGIKGCAIAILGVAIAIGGIILLAMWLA